MTPGFKPFTVLNLIYTSCRFEFDLILKILRFAKENFTALSNSLFNASEIEDFFRACALSSPVTLPTGGHVYRSDLSRSRLRLRQQEIWVRDYLHTNVIRTQHCLRNNVGNCCVRLHVATVLRCSASF